ncbi:MAG: hypothetical protein R2708_21775 [Vicinamibacterales bacterium]
MTPTLWVATRKGLFHLSAADGWRVGPPSFLGDPVSMVLDDARDGAVYAALQLGHFGSKLHRSDDRGATWTEVAVPSYAGLPDIARPNGPGGATAAAEPPSLKLLWALEAGGVAQPGRLWAGTIPGGLFRSDDRGASWTICRSLWDHPSRAKWFGGGYDWPGIHSVLVDPRDARRLVLGVSCGGAWGSDDDGATWSQRSAGMRATFMPPDLQGDPDVQDPHLLVRCAAAPDVLWTQHHCGIFRSRDNGRSWDEITAARPSNFGFAVAVHPTAPDTAWFAPAVKDERRVPVDGRLVVSRTRDGGATFDVLDRGLPAPAYDLVYRHGLAVDGTGTTLALGSTTGGLWLSSDGGDSWTALSTQLPPIYALRFGTA